jgi:uncharacterized protein YndB with AHSA1/START domain
MQATSHATVAAPIETVWGILTDHVGMSTWGPGGVTVTMDKAGTEEANGVGAVRRITTPGPGPAIVEEVVTYQRPHVFAYKALSGTPFPGYAGEVRLTDEGSRTRISYTISSTARFPLVKAPLAVLSQGLLRLLVRAVTKHAKSS